MNQIQPQQSPPGLDMPGLDKDDALYRILKGTATVTGEDFFGPLVENLCLALGTYSAWVTEYDEASHRLSSLALFIGGKRVPNFSLDIRGTPCEVVIDARELTHYPDNILNLFPESDTIRKLQGVSYMGIPMLEKGGGVTGNLAVLDTRPMPADPKKAAILRIFAARASAEIQRINAERDVRRREEKYRRIVEMAGEGFLLMDREFFITDVNDALCNMTGYRREDLIGRRPADFAAEGLRRFLRMNRETLFAKPFGEFEAVFHAKNGKQIPVLVHGTTLKNDRGEILGQMAFVTDLRIQKQSLELAAEVQRSFLPREMPCIRGFDIHWKTVACDEVGGDYLDFFDRRKCRLNRFGVAVGDVMGHGVDAALIVSSARALLRMSAGDCRGLASIVTRMNHDLVPDVEATDRFMTLFLMTVDIATQELRWVRAGHDPALLYDPDCDAFKELMGEGIALGIEKKYVYREKATSALPAGGIVALATDGIWESRNLNGDMYGRDRFKETIRKHARKDAADIVDAVFSDLTGFSNGIRQEDDRTLLIVKAMEAAEQPIDYQI